MEMKINPKPCRHGMIDCADCAWKFGLPTECVDAMRGDELVKAYRRSIGAAAKPETDPVHRPSHYTWIPGIECKDVTQHFPCMPGAAIKYIWRYQYKGKPVEDLRKAIECLQIEIERLTYESANSKGNRECSEVGRTQGDIDKRQRADKTVVKELRCPYPIPVVRRLCVVDGGLCVRGPEDCEYCPRHCGREKTASASQKAGVLDE